MTFNVNKRKYLQLVISLAFTLKSPFIFMLLLLENKFADEICLLSLTLFFLYLRTGIYCCGYFYADSMSVFVSNTVDVPV